MAIKPEYLYTSQILTLNLKTDIENNVKNSKWYRKFGFKIIDEQHKLRCRQETQNKEAKSNNIWTFTVTWENGD